MANNDLRERGFHLSAALQVPLPAAALWTWFLPQCLAEKTSHALQQHQVSSKNHDQHQQFCLLVRTCSNSRLLTALLPALPKAVHVYWIMCAVEHLLGLLLPDLDHQ